MTLTSNFFSFSSPNLFCSYFLFFLACNRYLLKSLLYFWNGIDALGTRKTESRSYTILIFRRETILRGDGYWHSQQGLTNEGDFGFLWSRAHLQHKIISGHED